MAKQTVGRARLGGGRGSRSIDTATYLPAHRINGSGTRRGGVRFVFIPLVLVPSASCHRVRGVLHLRGHDGSLLVEEEGEASR